MLGAGLPLHCVALTAPGEYDTHSDQPQALADGLDITAQSLFAFQRDLEARGLADRVLTLVWSEFGRRGEENGSDGTDHGAAGTAFLIGSRAKGQMIGEFPGLKNLDEDGNLRPTSDFRGGLLRARRAVAGRRRRRCHPGRPLLREADAALVTKVLATAVLALAFSWHPTPAQLGVSAKEFHLVLSRPSVKAGQVEIELQNDGEDVARPPPPPDRAARAPTSCRAHSPAAAGRSRSRCARAATGSGARWPTTGPSACRPSCASAADTIGPCASPSPSRAPSSSRSSSIATRRSRSSPPLRPRSRPGARGSPSFPRRSSRPIPSSTWAKALAGWAEEGAKEAFALLARESVEIPGPAERRLGEIAREHEVWLVTGVTERDPARPGHALQHAALSRA